MGHVRSTCRFFFKAAVMINYYCCGVFAQDHYSVVKKNMATTVTSLPFDFLLEALWAFQPQWLLQLKLTTLCLYYLLQANYCSCCNTPFFAEGFFFWKDTVLHQVCTAEWWKLKCKTGVAESLLCFTTEKDIHMVPDIAENICKYCPSISLWLPVLTYQVTCPSICVLRFPVYFLFEAWAHKSKLNRSPYQEASAKLFVVCARLSVTASHMASHSPRSFYIPKLAVFILNCKWDKQV